MRRHIISVVYDLDVAQVGLMATAQALVLVLEMLDLAAQVVHRHFFLHLFIVNVKLNYFLYRRH